MKPGTYTTQFLGTTIPVLYITRPHEAERIINKLREQSETVYAVDTETEPLRKYAGVSNAALSPHLSSVRLVQVFTGKNALVFDIKLLGEISEFRNFFEEAHFLGHNSVFDLQYFIRQFGVRSMNIGCTYLAAKLIMHATKPTDKGLSASLRNLVNIWFQSEIIKEMQTSDWNVPDLTWEQVEYAALDAISTYYLAKKLAEKLKALNLLKIYNLYKDAQSAIAKLQLNGIKLDTDLHRDNIAAWRVDLFKARKELIALTGLNLITGHTISKYLEKSLPPDVLAVWPRTETGKLATDSHVFADFDYLDIVRPFSEFQKKEKLCTSFGNSLIEQVNPETGRIHAHYNLAGARTGRLSCSQPNLQQSPRDSSFRKVFVPINGNVMLRADYSQIEIRVGAELSRDSVMLQAYRQGIDLHKLTASLLTHKDMDHVTKEERQQAKAFNFGLMFGLGSKKFSHYAKKSYGVEVSNDEAIKGVKTFRTTYSGYRAWQLSQAEKASANLTVSTPFGKRRKLNPDNYYGASMNTPVQGGASECMVNALIRLNKSLTERNVNAMIVNCVHDEIVVESCPSDAPDVSEMIRESMVKGFQDVFPKGITRDLVEVGMGKNWAEAKT